MRQPIFLSVDYFSLIKIDENTIESLAQYTKDYDVIVADFLLENENGKVLPCQHKNKKVFGDDKIGLY